MKKKIDWSYVFAFAMFCVIMVWFITNLIYTTITQYRTDPCELYVENQLKYNKTFNATEWCIGVNYFCDRVKWIENFPKK